MGFDVAFDKKLKRIQRIADNSPKAKFYYSDANWTYDKVSYFGTHSYFYDKSHTFTVEGINSDIRKYIAALQRRSKCFFRSLETFRAVMNIFVKAYNRFGDFKARFPKLKNSAYLTKFYYLYLILALPTLIPP